MVDKFLIASQMESVQNYFLIYLMHTILEAIPNYVNTFLINYILLKLNKLLIQNSKNM
jgi:hypothetical protein